MGFANMSDTPLDDESYRKQLLELSEQHAKERSELAEKISRLQQENFRLKNLLGLPASDDAGGDEHPADKTVSLEKKLGLDFSLPE